MSWGATRAGNARRAPSRARRAAPATPPIAGWEPPGVCTFLPPAAALIILLPAPGPGSAGVPTAMWPPAPRPGGRTEGRGGDVTPRLPRCRPGPAARLAGDTAQMALPPLSGGRVTCTRPNVRPSSTGRMENARAEPLGFAG